MRAMTLGRIDEAIESNKKIANLKIKISASREKGRSRKFRSRSKGEVEALTQISISRWNKAVSEGKIKSLGDRVLYYDYN
ncbi:hypothetical protein [Bacillus sp. T33-2]|uniref:hypothetical protein n=1 Tax=Bacillus sp. T33-2 TaxID=2054168 RepID=UPI000C757602|nr:hypothetical protein [Bacillus sp. T33-2]PLR94631.1 hypothetical protein CVD19_16835 [Bacillus sp. T33-2]